MKEEEILDSILEIDKFLSETESSLERKDYKSAMLKLREARQVIEELKEDDESEIDREEIGMDVMKHIK